MAFLIPRHSRFQTTTEIRMDGHPDFSRCSKSRLSRNCTTLTYGPTSTHFQKKVRLDRVQRHLLRQFKMPRTGTSRQEPKSQSSPDEFRTTPQTITKPVGRSKGSTNLKQIINVDPEAIAPKTRSKLAKGEYDKDGANDAVIFNRSTWHISNQSKPPSGSREYWTFSKNCQLASCQNSCELDNFSQCPQNGPTENQVQKQECVQDNNGRNEERWQVLQSNNVHFGQQRISEHS